MAKPKKATSPLTKHELFLAGEWFKVAGDPAIYSYQKSLIQRGLRGSWETPHEFANVIDATEHSVTYTIVSMGTVYQQTLRWEDVTFIHLPL